MRTKLNFDAEFTSEKLGYDFFNKTIKPAFKQYIIESDTGTGKTTAIKHYIKDNNLKFISVTSRKTLAQEHYRIFNNFDLDCQLYTDNKLECNKSSITQVESIIKIFSIIKPDEMKDYILILDEVSSFIQHIVTSPTVKDKRKILKLVLTLIKNCKLTICVDACINDTVKMFFNYFDESTPLYIQNKFKNNKDTKAVELQSYDQLKDNLKKLDKFMVCCDSANKAKQLYKELEDDNIKLITSEINETNEIIDLDKNNKIIFSPKVVYGLDSTLKRNVFCYYTGQTIDAKQMYQQLSRTRNIETLYFYFANKPTRTQQYQTYEDVKKCNDILTLWYKEINYTFDYSPIDNLIDELKNFHKFELDLCRADIFKSFVEILNIKGFQVALQTTTLKGIKTNKDLISEYHQEIYDYETNLINKYLKLPEEVAIEHIDLLCDGHKLQNHFNICRWLEEDKWNNGQEFINKSEYMLPDELVTSSVNKMKLLYKLLEITNSTKENISIKTKIDKVHLEAIQTEYNLCFSRGTLNVTDEKSLMKVILNLVKDLFNNEIYDKTQKQINGIRTRTLTLKQDVSEHHLSLIQYRKQGIIEYNSDSDSDSDDEDKIDYIKLLDIYPEDRTKYKQ